VIKIHLVGGQAVARVASRFAFITEQFFNDTGL
jgi:hypothetical protein